MVSLDGVKRWILTAAAAGLAGCGSPSALEVSPTHLRGLEVADEGARMVRAEQLRRFHGAMGVRERERRLGHYYDVDWRDEGVGEPVTVRFDYQQGGSGSRVHTLTEEFDAARTEGRAEFRIVGDDYLQGGRVLAWRCGLWRGDREVASRASYLWSDPR